MCARTRAKEIYTPLFRAYYVYKTHLRPFPRGKGRMFALFKLFCVLFPKPRLCAKFAVQNAFSNAQGLGRYFQKLVVGNKF